MSEVFARVYFRETTLMRILAEINPCKMEFTDVGINHAPFLIFKHRKHVFNVHAIRENKILE